jgi:hypothetical protein
MTPLWSPSDQALAKSCPFWFRGQLPISNIHYITPRLKAFKGFLMHGIVYLQPGTQNSFLDECQPHTSPLPQSEMPIGCTLHRDDLHDLSHSVSPSWKLSPNFLTLPHLVSALATKILLSVHLLSCPHQPHQPASEVKDPVSQPATAAAMDMQQVLRSIC